MPLGKAWEGGEGEELESGYFGRFGNGLDELLRQFQHGEVLALWICYVQRAFNFLEASGWSR